MEKNTWFARFQRTLGAFFPVADNRTGQCAQCGACCLLPVRCRFLREDEEKNAYCAIYKIRPLNCRKYPRTAQEFITENTCGFSFDKK